MPKVDTPPRETTDGWMVQIYNRDRRLICLVDPSHGWAFFFGCLAGFVIAAVGFSRTSQISTEPIDPPQTPATVAPLQVE